MNLKPLSNAIFTIFFIYDTMNSSMLCLKEVICLGFKLLIISLTAAVVWLIYNAVFESIWDRTI